MSRPQPAARRKSNMSTNVSENTITQPASDTPASEKRTKAGRKSINEAKAAKKASRAKKSAAKSGEERSNKKAEVIAMMKRAKGATLAEIMAATGWQKHTVRGFVSILGSKGGHSIQSSKNAAGERTYKIAK